MKRTALLLLLSALTLLADVTGNWSGAATGRFRDDENRDTSEPISLTLKQDGATVTGGLVAPGSRQPIPIQNGTVDGDTVKFDVGQATGSLLHFELKAGGDQIKGEMKFHKAAGDTAKTFKVFLQKMSK
ncbi:MAG TPA: hypothetical protein VGH38_37820 [Bryobacteraceae bacterium]